jgi:hypothetical protein
MAMYSRIHVPRIDAGLVDGVIHSPSAKPDPTLDKGIPQMCQLELLEALEVEIKNIDTLRDECVEKGIVVIGVYRVDIFQEIIGIDSIQRVIVH